MKIMEQAHLEDFVRIRACRFGEDISDESGSKGVFGNGFRILDAGDPPPAAPDSLQHSNLMEKPDETFHDELR